MLVSCSLAWCELYLLISTVFRRYEMKIHETGDDDMAWTDHLLMLYVYLWSPLTKEWFNLPGLQVQW